MAKWLTLKSSGLSAVIEKQEKFQSCFVKINPALMNVSSALLKWSYAESNLSLFDVFSAWSDLDFALAQLSKTLMQQLFAFKQMFENIKGEEKSLAKLQGEAENASKRVRQALTKLERAEKKKDKDKCESDLTLARGSEKELLSNLAAREKVFELNKAKWVKDILKLLSRTYVEHLEKSMQVWKEKLSIAEAMADEPVYHAEQLNTESAQKVSAIFHKFSMDLPQREVEPEDRKSRTLPNQPPPVPEKGRGGLPANYVTTVSSESTSGDDFGDNDYAMPDDLPTGDQQEDYLLVKEKEDNAEEERAPPAPPRSPPTIPSSPVPSSPASSLKDNVSTDSSSSNLAEARSDPTGLRGFKVLPTIPPPMLRRPLEQTLSLPSERKPPIDPPPIPPPAVDPPPTPPAASASVAGPAPSRKPPPSPRPRLSQFEQEMYRNEAPRLPDKTTFPPAKPLPVLPDRTSSLPVEEPRVEQPLLLPEKPPTVPEGPPPQRSGKPAVSRKPLAIRSKPPTRPPRPANREGVDNGGSPVPAPAPGEHPYSDVPIEVEDRHEAQGARKEISSFLHNNNIKQVVESDSDSDSDFDDDYEYVDNKR